MDLFWTAPKQDRNSSVERREKEDIFARFNAFFKVDKRPGGLI